VRSAWRRRSPLAFYGLAAIAMWLLSLGPSPTFMNAPVLYQAPYAWLMLLPGVEGVRVPARFWMLGALCLAVAAGLAVRHLAARWPRAAAALPVVACILVVAESWPRPMAVWAPPAARPSRTAAVARLDLPMRLYPDIAALFRSIAHRRPMINGYSGYVPPHYWALGYLLEARNPSVLSRLAEYGPIEVIVEHREDEAHEWRRFVAAHPSARMIYTDAQYTSYRIQPGDRPPVTAVQGVALPIASIAATVNQQAAAAMIDDDFDTAWRTVRPQAAGDGVTVDLGQPRGIAGAEMLIGGYVADFPRRLIIETSLDGRLWTEAWNGDPALIAFSAALEDPLHSPLQFPIQPLSARYVRLTQVGEVGTGVTAAAWSIVELRVKGR
jgi:F5/8 type C domain-containing protein